MSGHVVRGGEVIKNHARDNIVTVVSISILLLLVQASNNILNDGFDDDKTRESVHQDGR